MAPRKAAGVLGSLKRKQHILEDGEYIYLSDAGMDAAAVAALAGFPAELQELAALVISAVQDRVDSPEEWVRDYGMDAPRRAIDKFIDGDIYRHADALMVVETKLQLWMLGDEAGDGIPRVEKELTEMPASTRHTIWPA